MARRLRGAASPPDRGGDARLRKIDNFLPSRPRCCIVFQKVQEARRTLPVGDARPRLRRQEQGTTRKWRHKPLKSLKTDSQMGNYRLAVDGGNRSGESRIYSGGPPPSLARQSFSKRRRLKG